MATLWHNLLQRNVSSIYIMGQEEWKKNTESDDDSFSRCTYITSMTADEWYSNSSYCYWPQRRTIPMSLTFMWRPLSQNRTDCSIKPAVYQHQHMSNWFRTTIGIITQPRWHESPMSMRPVRLVPVWIPCGRLHNSLIYISPVYYISRSGYCKFQSNTAFIYIY